MSPEPDPFGLDYDDSDGCEFSIDHGYRAEQERATPECRRCPEPAFRAGLCESHWEQAEDFGGDDD